MLKKRLFTPGPTEVPAEVLVEMARPIFHHRTPEFRSMFSDVTAGLKEGGWILINSELSPSSFGLPDKYRVVTVDANSIAIEHRLGPRSAPIVNTAILGAFSRVTGLVSLDTLSDAVREAVPIDPDGNVAATREAYQQVKMEGGLV